MSNKFCPVVVFSILFLTWTCAKKTPESSPLPQEPMNLSKVVIGYYPSWKKDVFDCTKIKYEYLTHIAHAFTKPDSAGNLIVSPDYYYPELISEAHRRNVKVIMSIGGWGNCEGFPGMAATSETRTRFINQVMNFLIQYAYDGVDIDWEYVSNPTEKQNFVYFIKELSAVLKAQSPPRLLTMAGPAGSYWGQWFDFEQTAAFFDYVSCMTYDFHGPWTDHSGPNAPMYSCENDPCGSYNDGYNYYISRGVPGSKLLLGLPFYGRSFDCDAFYEKFTTSLGYDYKDVMPLLESGWVYFWDECSQTPFVLNPDKSTIVSYDDERSIGLKCQYVLDKKAAGLIIWEVNEDYYNGSSVLLKVVGESFKNKGRGEKQ